MKPLVDQLIALFGVFLMMLLYTVSCPLFAFMSGMTLQAVLPFHSASLLMFGCSFVFSTWAVIACVLAYDTLLFLVKEFGVVLLAVMHLYASKTEHTAKAA
jgi:hypothetical protein